MVATLSLIFLSFHPSCSFVTHILISRISWNVTLDDRIYTLTCISFIQWGISPRHAFLNLLICNLLMRLWILHPYYCLFVLRPTNVLSQTQGPTYNFGPHIPTIALKTLVFPLLSEEKKMGFDSGELNPFISLNLHIWEYCFAWAITIPDTSKLAMSH